jgi:methylmalonyl-CoA/ethylmalonyl-CoA epimerase
MATGTGPATGLDHIGVAVADMKASLAFYKQALGLDPSGFDEADQSKIAFLPIGDTRIELLEGIGPDSPISKSVAKRGPGVHHLCFRVPDIHAAFARMKASGAQVIDAAPRTGAHGCTVFFVHPKSAGGVLIEFSQPPADGSH